MYKFKFVKPNKLRSTSHKYSIDRQQFLEEQDLTYNDTKLSEFLKIDNEIDMNK